MKWLLVSVIVLCNTMGDVLNTAGMKQQGELEDLSPHGFQRMLAHVVRNPLVLAGLASLAISFFALLSLLSIANVSFAVPATGASYLLETLLAKYVLQEHVDWHRWLGSGIVICGLVLLSA